MEDPYPFSLMVELDTSNIMIWVRFLTGVIYFSYNIKSFLFINPLLVINFILFILNVLYRIFKHLYTSHFI